MSNANSDRPGPLSLTSDQETMLHREASRLVALAVAGRPAEFEDASLDGLAQALVVGTFVTLRNNGDLRGCIGNFAFSTPLGDALRRAAVNAATRDSRFEPVSVDELADLTVEVSLLHSRQVLGPTAEERLIGTVVGRDGLDIQAERHAGLLLPQVPTEQGWDSEQFLEAVCRKAGLPSDAWRDPTVNLYRFRGTYFGGPLAMPSDG